MAVLTLVDLKSHLNIPDGNDQDDAEMQRVLDAATDIVTDIAGPLQGTSVTEVHYGLASDVIVLGQAPVAALTAITGAANGVALPADHYALDQRAGIVRLLGGRRFWGDVTVNYNSGWSDVPAAVELAVLIIAAQLWETQRVPGTTRSAGFGQSAAPVVPVGFAIPNRAAELLAPYRLGALP